MCRILTGTLYVNMAGCDNVVVWNIYVFKLWDDKFDIFTAYSGTLVSLSWQPPTYPGDSFIMTAQGRILLKSSLTKKVVKEIDLSHQKDFIIYCEVVLSLLILLPNKFAAHFPNVFAPGLGADRLAGPGCHQAKWCVQTLDSYPFSSLWRIMRFWRRVWKKNSRNLFTQENEKQRNQPCLWFFCGDYKCWQLQDLSWLMFSQWQYQWFFIICRFVQSTAKKSYKIVDELALKCFCQEFQNTLWWWHIVFSFSLC